MVAVTVAERREVTLITKQEKYDLLKSREYSILKLENEIKDRTKTALNRLRWIGE